MVAVRLPLRPLTGEGQAALFGAIDATGLRLRPGMEHAEP